MGVFLVKYAYGRCSTNETKQDIQRQINELKEAGAEIVFFEYEHGDAEHKKELERLFDVAKAGDTIITLEVSRLARSTKQLCDIIERIKEKHLCLVILGSVTVDCTKGEIDPMTKAFLQMAGVFSELELEMIRARVRSGMANAKSKGRAIGRPKTSADNIPAIFYKHYPSYINGTLNAMEFARVCGIGRTTLYKYLSLVNQKKDGKD